MGLYIETEELEELTGVEEVDVCPDCGRTISYPGTPPDTIPMCPDCGARMEDFDSDELSGLGRSRAQRRRRKRRKKKIAQLFAALEAKKISKAQFDAAGAALSAKRARKKTKRRKAYQRVGKIAAVAAVAVVAGPTIIKGVTAAGKGIFSVGKTIVGAAGQLLTSAPQPLEEPVDDFDESFEPYFDPPQLSAEEDYYGPPAAVMQPVAAGSTVGPVRPLRFTRAGLARSRLFGGSV